MTILNLKGFKVVSGTTLIKTEALSDQKGGDGKYNLFKFVQCKVSRQELKALKDLAWERSVPQRELLVGVIENFLKKEKQLWH